MKYFKFMSLFTIVFFTMSSCTDLDLENIGTQTAESYFNDPENALAGLNACYSTMSKDEYFVYGDLMSDDALKGGSDLFDWAERQYVRDFTANAGNGVSSGTWSLLYTGIVRTNEIINSLPEATFDEELKERIIGEANTSGGNYVAWFENGSSWTRHNIGIMDKGPFFPMITNIDFDGNIDIIVSGQTKNMMWYELLDPKRTGGIEFWMKRQVDQTREHMLSFDIADMNNDHLNDIISITPTEIVWYEQKQR